MSRVHVPMVSSYVMIIITKELEIHTLFAFCSGLVGIIIPYAVFSLVNQAKTFERRSLTIDLVTSQKK
jgi:hypothetical protein